VAVEIPVGAGIDAEIILETIQAAVFETVHLVPGGNPQPDAVEGPGPVEIGFQENGGVDFPAHDDGDFVDLKGHVHLNLPGMVFPIHDCLTGEGR